MPALRIALSGASGLIGRALQPALQACGHTVVPLVRPGSGRAGIAWDPVRGGIDAAALRACDAVVHLAGESVAQRWTRAARARIWESRVAGTGLLARTLAEDPGQVRTWVSASGVALATSTGDAPVSEAEDHGQGFLADVVRAWEGAAAPLATVPVRTVILRTGMVLTPEGGALAQMLRPFRLGLGGPVGHGQQWVPWISRAGLVAHYRHAIEDPAVVGPHHAVTAYDRQRDLARLLGRVLGRPAVLPLPAWVVGVLLGDMGRELLLASQPARPSPQLPREAGDLEAVLRWLTS